MTPPDTYDVAIIGGGPAGYSAALRCAEHGMTTAVIEREAVGGTCLNVGCIPSKALIHAADRYHALGADRDLATIGIGTTGRTLDLAATMRWKDAVVQRLRDGVEGQLARGGIEVVRAEAEIVDPRTVRATSATGTRILTARSLIVATGSRPVELPELPFGGPVLSSTAALALEQVPDRLVVVGGGYIGLELGTALAKLGARVTIVEMGSRLLPLFDAALVRPVARRLDDLGVAVRTSTSATGFADGVLRVCDDAGTVDGIAADAVLVTVGRRPVVEGFGLERLGLVMDGGAIAVDGQGATSARGVYAIGDVTGEPMLAHRGIAQGELVADVLAGEGCAWDHRAIPAVCFTDPEVCAVGLSPDDPELAGLGDRVLVGRASFGANGRAHTLEDHDGFVRVVADGATGAVLGVQAVGPGVAELAAVACLAVELATTIDDLAATVIAHPTLAETLSGAVADARRRATAADGGTAQASGGTS